MKESSIIICKFHTRYATLVAVSVAFTVLLTGCFSELVPSPEIESLEDSNSGTSSTSISAPNDLSATQGEKQKITLSWTSVNKAVLYYVYAAATPFDSYVKIGETTSRSYEYSVAAGLTRYFKVTAVNYEGTESGASSIVTGNSLACPIISDIIQVDGEEDNSLTVYWYMANADAYVASLKYVITCLNGTTVVASGSMDGALEDGTTADTSYTFSGLTQKTTYQYTVEAYLITAQTDSELSDAVDQATAVSLKPKAPVSIAASEGTSTSSVSVSFVLPEEAYIKQSSSSGTSSSADTYIQYPLYFNIYRRLAVDEGKTANAWEELSGKIYYSASDTGSYTKTAPTSADAYVAVYDEGKTITYTDSASLTRGKKYDYKVQSYVYGKGTTSSASCATTTGWEAAAPTLKTRNFTYTYNDGKTAKTKASLSFTAAWESFNKESNYTFILKTNRTQIVSSDDADSVAYKVFSSLSAVNSYIAEYDIANSIASCRGYYKYTLYIAASGTTDDTAATATASALDYVIAPGTILVTDELSLPTFTGLSTTSGYKDKVIVSWTKESADYTYELDRYPVDDNGNQTGSESAVSIDLSSTTVGTTYSCSDTTGITSGIDYVYTLYATTSSGLKVPSDPITAETLGTPSVSFDATSTAYDSITATWSPVQQALSYTVTLANGSETISSDIVTVTTDSDGNSSYTVSGTDANNSVSVSAAGLVSYKIASPTGYNDATVSGKSMTFTVQTLSAVNDTTSGSNTVCTLGPSQTGVTATVAKNTDSVVVTWNVIDGANGYLVRRDRCNSANSAIVSTDLYLVPASPTGSTSEIKANKETVSAATATVDSNKITFTDSYTAAPSSSATTWQTNQDKLAWGYPYRYTVFPMHSTDDSYDVPTDTTVTIGSVTYSKSSSVSATGSTIGYGVDVRATKAEDPTKVTVTWTKPYLGTTSPDPKLWRSVDGANTWEKASASIDSTGNFIVSPTGSERIQAYDYAVVYNGQTPHSTYLAAMTATLDTTYSATEPLNKGYPFSILATATNVTTSGDVGYSEKVGWTLWDYSTRAVGPATSATYTVAVKNANYASGWQTIAIVSSSGTITPNNPSEYAITMTESGQTLTLTPTNMSDTAINVGLLRVLRDYKHYYEVIITRTNSEGTAITASYADSDLYAYRKISNAEFTKAAMLAITYGFYMAQTGDDTDYSDIGNESKIYSAKSTNGASGTFSYTNGTIVPALGFVPYKHTFTFGSYVPAQLAESGDSVSFMKISSSAQVFYRYELTDGWFKLFYTSPSNFTISCYDSSLSEYSGSLAVTCSGRTNVSISVTRSSGATATFSASTNDTVHNWFPMRFYDDSKYYIKDADHGWW